LVNLNLESYRKRDLGKCGFSLVKLNSDTVQNHHTFKSVTNLYKRQKSKRSMLLSLVSKGLEVGRNKLVFMRI
jgi:hypothetical protein